MESRLRQCEGESGYRERESEETNSMRTVKFGTGFRREVFSHVHCWLIDMTNLPFCDVHVSWCRRVRRRREMMCISSL